MPGVHIICYPMMYVYSFSLQMCWSMWLYFLCFSLQMHASLEVAHKHKFVLVRKMHTVFYNSFHFTVSSPVCCFLFMLIPKCSTQLQRHARSNRMASGWPSSSRPSVRRPASLRVSLPWPPVLLRALSTASCTRKSNRSRGV